MSQNSELDYTKIDFPTDQLTLGQIRRLSPEQCPRGQVAAGTKLDDAVGSLEAWCEHNIAENTYEHELRGMRGPVPDESEGGTLERLDKFYREMGWSSGLHQTKQIIRRFSEAVRQQAREARGRGK
ncbi:MAG: hypothetical protein AAF354_04035 [Pseudomonadota bacterium]